MNLYLISQTANRDWDTYRNAVVAAESEEEAKTIHPGGDLRIPLRPRERGGFHHLYRTWVDDPAQVTAKLIGTAAEGTKAGEIVCVSFCAG